MRIRDLLSRPRKAPATQTKQRPRPLTFEQMEDRCVPSVLFGDTPGLTVSDNNGPVLSNAQVRLIFWGNGWNSGIGPTLRTQVQNAIDTLNASTYFYSPLPGADLSQYRAGSQSRPTRVASFTDTYNSPGLTFTSNDVFTMLQHEFGMTPNYYYYVIPDPNSTPTGCGCTAEHTYWFQGSNREYYGFSRNLASPSLDDLTYLYSHEMAESITDPDGTALQVNPRGASAWNEIADGEAQGYSYRVSGILAQSYWSRANGKFTVPTGQTQNFFVSHNHVLTVNGDQLANHNDAITLDVSGGGVRVTLNGEVAQFEPGAISGIVVNTLTGNDTVNVERTLAAAPVTINLGGGTDTVNISPAARTLGNIQGAVTIHYGLGVDTVNVDDQSTTTAQTFSMGANTVQRSGSALISYGPGINFVNINGGSGNTTYNINGTETSWATTLNTGNGSDTVNVEDANSGTFTINEGTGGVNVNVSPSARNLNNIQGMVTVNGGSAGVDNLTINDQNNAANQTFTLNANSFSRTGSGVVTINNLVNSVTINAGNGANTYTINNTNGFSVTTLNTGNGNDTVNVVATTRALTIDEQGSGTDTVTLSPTAQNLNNIQGAVTIAGNSGTDTLTINDRNNSANQTYTMTATSVTRTGAAAITFGTLMNFVTLNGGSGSDTFTITGTGGLDATTLNDGSGTNTVNIQGTSAVGLTVNTIAGDVITIGSAAETLDPIGGVTINDGSGAASVTLDDSGFAGSDDYVLSASSVSLGRSSTFLLAYSGIGSLTLDGGSGGEIYDIDSTSAVTTVNGGAGSNCFHVSPFTQYLAANILGPSLALNGSGADTLDFFDANDPGAETFSFDAVPSSLTLGSTGTDITDFSGMGGVYVVTNGFSTPDDQSGTVIFDPAGGPPCVAGTGSSSRGLVQDHASAHAIPVPSDSSSGSRRTSTDTPLIVHGRPAPQSTDAADLLDRVFSLWE